MKSLFEGEDGIACSESNISIYRRREIVEIPEVDDQGVLDIDMYGNSGDLKGLCNSGYY